MNRVSSYNDYFTEIYNVEVEKCPKLPYFYGTQLW